MWNRMYYVDGNFSPLFKSICTFIYVQGYALHYLIGSLILWFRLLRKLLILYLYGTSDYSLHSMFYTLSYPGTTFLWRCLPNFTPNSLTASSLTFIPDFLVFPNSPTFFSFYYGIFSLTIIYLWKLLIFWYSLCNIYS